MIYSTVNKHFVAIFIFVFSITTLCANGSRPIFKGRIIDNENNRPIANVVVRIPFLKTSTATDKEGYFTLESIKRDSIVVKFEKEGYGNRYVVIDLKKDTETFLLYTNNNLSYSKGRSDLASRERGVGTGSVTIIDSEGNLERVPGENVLSSLQGRVAGLYITEEEGQGVTIQLRGQNSFNIDNTPLFVVNGIPYPAKIISAESASITPLVGLKSADIERVEILKDSDATTLYGSRGANGVILITTKPANAGKLRINADISSGFTRILKRLDLLDVNEYLEMRQKAMNMDGITPNEQNAYDLLLWGDKYKTDWQKALLGNSSKVHNGQISITGGNINTNFSAGLGFYQTGYVVLDQNDDKFKRLNGRLSVRHMSANKKFDFNSSILFSSVNTSTMGSNPGMNILTAPNQPMYDEKGEIYWIPDNANFSNALRMKYVRNENILNNILGSMSLGYTFSEAWKAKVDLGYSKAFSDELGSYGNGYYNPYRNNNIKNQAFYGNSYSESVSIEPQLNYMKDFGRARLTGLLGATWHSMSNKKARYQMLDFPSEALFRNPSSAARKGVIESSFSQYKYGSLFGRLTYDLGSKYVINGIVRGDGSSRFSSGNRFGTFWSIGSAWIFSREDFFNVPFISYGKLRGSYGSTGNDQVGDFLFLETYLSTDYAYGDKTGLYQKDLADKKFKWEVTRKAEIALELGLLNDRITVTTCIFDNRSDDLIVPFQLASQSGFGQLRTNMRGVIIQNKGLEVELFSQNIKSTTLNWMTSFNISFLDNKLLAYPDLEESPYATTYQIGKSINTVRAYKYTGIDRETGVAQFLDVNNDGLLSSEDDRPFIDKTDVRFYGGLFNTISYKNFQFDFNFVFTKQPFRTGWLGNYPFPPGYLNQNTLREIYYNSWTPENKDAKYPAMTSSRSGERGVAYIDYYRRSDALFTDASYIRLQNLGLTYLVPSKIVRKINLSSCRLFVKAQNVYTFSKTNVWDPETGGAIPPAFTLIFGTKLSF